MTTLSKKNLDYFQNGSFENKKFWKRLNEKPSFEEKTILDFGCGHGALCIDIAKNSPKKIIGVDLDSELIEFADENLRLNYPKFKDIVEFKKVNILDVNFSQKFDLIVSKDTFEHTLDLDKVLNKFYNILNFNGLVYLGFGPLYNFFNGDHGRTQLKLPWLHALMPEKLIIQIYNIKNNKKIKDITDLGLNKYSLQQYKDFFKNSKFEIIYYKTNLSDHPASKIFSLFKNMPILDEYFTNNIYCILKKSF